MAKVSRDACSALTMVKKECSLMQEIAQSEIAAINDRPVVDTTKDTQIVRQYVLQRGLRRVRFEVRRRNSDWLYFTVEGFFDGEEKKVDWIYSPLTDAKDMSKAVAKGELCVQKWCEEGWKVIYQVKRVPKAKKR
jgi:hypothetical protein